MPTHLDQFRIGDSIIFYQIKQHQSPISVFSIFHSLKSSSEDSVSR